jgi:hypothetical protein
MVRTTCRPTTCVTAHIVYTAMVGTAEAVQGKQRQNLSHHPDPLTIQKLSQTPHCVHETNRFTFARPRLTHHDHVMTALAQLLLPLQICSIGFGLLVGALLTLNSSHGFLYSSKMISVSKASWATPTMLLMLGQNSGAKIEEILM